MGEYQITVIDASLVGVIIAVTQWAKQYVNERWVPLVPVVVSLLLSAPAVIVAERTWPGWLIFGSMWILETVKLATLAMASYKITTTTVMGR